MKDVFNYTKSIPTAARIGSLFGPLPFAAGLIGTSIADKFGFTQAGRDRIAREEAAARGAAKQNMAEARALSQAAARSADRVSNRDAARGSPGGGGGMSSGQAAANREGARGGQYGF